MTLLCEAFGPEAARQAAPPCAVVSRAETVLLAALRADVALALWLRELPRGWGRTLRPLLGMPFRACGEGSPEAALDAAAAALPGPAPLELLADALRLAHVFAALTRCGDIRLRFDGVTGDACRRFHVDAVGFRLLVTYAGPGTEWTLGDPDQGAGIERVPTGAVAMFRGAARPGGHLRHRSPPLSHLPEARRTRLLLCIDEAS